MDGYKGSPVIQSVSLNTPMKTTEWLLVLWRNSCKFGFTRSKSMYASYAYRIRIGNGKLSFGLKAGADLSNTSYPDNGFLTTPGDPVFINDKSYILPNVGAGLYYFSDKLFAEFQSLHF